MNKNQTQTSLLLLIKMDIKQKIERNELGAQL